MGRIFFGVAFLSDYGGIFLLPALAAAVWVRGPAETGWGRSLWRLAAGEFFLPRFGWATTRFVLVVVGCASISVSIIRDGS